MGPVTPLGGLSLIEGGCVFVSVCDRDGPKNKLSRGDVRFAITINQRSRCGVQLFVGGRFTKAQAIVKHWDRRWQAGPANDLGMEIVCMGHELIAWAEQQPKWQLPDVGLPTGSMLSRWRKIMSNVRLVDEPAQVM